MPSLLEPQLRLVLRPVEEGDDSPSQLYRGRLFLGGLAEELERRQGLAREGLGFHRSACRDSDSSQAIQRPGRLWSVRTQRGRGQAPRLLEQPPGVLVPTLQAEGLRQGGRGLDGDRRAGAEQVRRELTRLFEDLHAACRSNPEAAAKLLGKTKPATGDVAEAAAWVALARTLLNLDEFVTRE